MAPKNADGPIALHRVPSAPASRFPPKDAKYQAAIVVAACPAGASRANTPSPIGKFHITMKDKNPTWIVPDSIYKTMDKPRRVVPPGPDNPMGEYRIRISTDIYSIHGTDTPWAIGRQTTHGCIRLYPEDIGELYAIATPKMAGEMVYEPIKFGEAAGRVFIEVHDDVYGRYRSLEREAFRLAIEAGVGKRVDDVKVMEAVRERRGVPIDVTRSTLPAILTQRDLRDL